TRSGHSAGDAWPVSSGCAIVLALAPHPDPRGGADRASARAADAAVFLGLRASRGRGHQISSNRQSRPSFGGARKPPPRPSALSQSRSSADGSAAENAKLAKAGKPDFYSKCFRSRTGGIGASFARKLRSLDFDFG